MLRGFLGGSRGDGNGGDGGSDGQQQRPQASTDHEIQSAERYSSQASFAVSAACDSCGRTTACDCGGHSGGVTDAERAAAGVLVQENDLTGSPEDVLSAGEDVRDALVSALGYAAVTDWDTLVRVSRGEHEDVMAEVQQQAAEGSEGDPSGYGTDMFTDGGHAAVNADDLPDPEELTEAEVSALREAVAEALNVAKPLVESVSVEALLELAEGAEDVDLSGLGGDGDGGTESSEAAALRQRLTDVTPLTDEWLQRFDTNQLRAVLARVRDPSSHPPVSGIAAATSNRELGDRLAYREQARNAVAHCDYLGKAPGSDPADEAEDDGDGSAARRAGRQSAGTDRAAPRGQSPVNYAGLGANHPVSDSDDSDTYTGRGVFQSMREDGEAD